MEHATEERDDLVKLFEESFRNIEASRVGETIMRLCEAIAGGKNLETCSD